MIQPAPAQRLALETWHANAGIFQFALTSLILCFSAIVEEGQTGLCKLLNHLESNWRLTWTAQHNSLGQALSCCVKQSGFTSGEGPGLGVLAFALGALEVWVVNEHCTALTCFYFLICCAFNALDIPLLLLYASESEGDFNSLRLQVAMGFSLAAGKKGSHPKTMSCLCGQKCQQHLG